MNITIFDEYICHKVWTSKDTTFLTHHGNVEKQSLQCQTLRQLSPFRSHKHHDPPMQIILPRPIPASAFFAFELPLSCPACSRRFKECNLPLRLQGTDITLKNKPACVSVKDARGCGWKQVQRIYSSITCLAGANPPGLASVYRPTTNHQLV